MESKRKRSAFSAEGWLLQNKTLKSRFTSVDKTPCHFDQVIKKIQFPGEPVPAAFGAEGQQSDQIGGTGEQIISTFGGKLL